MTEISESNPLPNKKRAKDRGALKISKKSDDYIFDEIHRRDKLENVEFEDVMMEDKDQQFKDETTTTTTTRITIEVLYFTDHGSSADQL